jgi:glycosyltransferase involved in cell wall biosynthesis
VRISIVIPAYNAQAFIAGAIESCLSQSYAPQEIIIVDDASRDRTAEIASSFPPPVRVIRLGENIGAAGARNRGLQSSTGDWIAFLDADDRFVSTKLERQVNQIQPSSVLVYSGFWEINGDGVRNAVPAVHPADARRVIRYRNPIATSTVLAQRLAVLRSGGFREDVLVCEDWDLWARLARLGQFAAVKDPLTEYYVRPASLGSDPEQLLLGLQKIIESTLLVGLSGPSRWCWRRRIISNQMRSAGFLARKNGLPTETDFMLRSLLTWPSPFWQPRRFAALGVTAWRGWQSFVKS